MHSPVSLYKNVASIDIGYNPLYPWLLSQTLFLSCQISFMATTQIPSVNSAFRPYNKGVLQKCEMIKAKRGSSGVDFWDGFKLPSWEGPSKKIRVNVVRRPSEEEEDKRVCVVESKKRDYLGRLKIEGRENGNETMEKTSHSEKGMKKKKKVIENTNNDGNSPTPKASSNTKNFLFEKKLFPSDVSNLNRLLIPRKLAEKFFPHLKITKQTYKKETLVFFDHQSIAWEMKFKFWVSSQSYVLTKGWRAFVNKYQLKPNFVIRFYQLDQFLDKKHYGIEYVVGRPMKIIKLFGQDFHCLCPEAINGGQNKIVGQGEAEEAMKKNQIELVCNALNGSLDPRAEKVFRHAAQETPNPWIYAPPHNRGSKSNKV